MHKGSTKDCGNPEKEDINSSWKGCRKLPIELTFALGLKGVPSDKEAGVMQRTTVDELRKQNQGNCGICRGAKHCEEEVSEWG